MTQLELQSISKSYPGGVQAVKSFDLVVKEGDFVVLVGPSGCGKTTVLRIIAGLEDIDEGSLILDGVEISKVTPKERGVAMIFQDYALYPHLTVRENIAFPLRMLRFSKAHIKELTEEIAQSLQIIEVLDRKPSALSGGQRQRVAIARALVRKPKICLLDEPFSNLDAQLRVQMRGELARIYRDHNMTVIFVTHDQTEAMALGTRIVVMKDGVIQQADSSKQLYQNPANLFVAGFFGTPPMNTFPALLTGKAGVWSACVGDDSKDRDSPINSTFTLDPARLGSLTDAFDGVRVVVGIRPEHIRLAAEEISDAPCFSVEVVRIEEFGSEGYLYTALFDTPLVVRIPQFVQLAEETSVNLTFDPKDCYIFDALTGINLLHDNS